MTNPQQQAREHARAIVARALALATHQRRRRVVIDADDLRAAIQEDHDENHDAEGRLANGRPEQGRPDCVFRHARGA